MSYQTLVQGDRIAFATQQGASLNQIAIITTDIPSRSTIYFGPSNIFRQDGTIDATQAVMAIDVFNKTVRVGSTYISSGGGVTEAHLVSTTVALLAGAGVSSDGLNVLQLTSTVIGASATNAQLNNTLTSTVTGQFVSFSPALQAGLSTLGHFTSNTSNYYKNNLINYSTTISSISTSVGANSNWSRGAFQDWSTPVSSVSTAAGQTSNWARGTLQNWSTSVSTVALFTSNTSNWAANIQQNWSSAVSIATLYTSNTSNWSRGLLQDYSTPVSTVALYTSNTSNWAANIQQNWSSAVSTATLFTSNTSNWSKNMLQDYSTAVSTVALFTSNSSNYFMANAGGSGTSSLLGVISSGFSTIALFTSNTSNYFLPALSNNYSTNLQSTVAGLGTAGYISTGQFLSSMIGINSNISSMIDPVELASSVVGLGTVGFVSAIGLTAILNSTVVGVNTYVSSMIDPVELTSSIIGLGAAGFISTVGLDNRLASTVFGVNSNMYSTTSGTSTQIANVYQFSRGLLQDYSTPVSSVSTTAGQTSNWSRNLLQDYSTPVSTVFFYSRNLLQDFSTPVSSVSLFTSNTSNYARNILQDWSTPVNTLNLFTQNTSNYAKNILQDWSTPVSTVALYTSNTSNWASNIQQNWSSAVSVATLYTSNTSNWAKNAQQDWSTPVSTVALYASNTSNWASNIQQNWSSAVSIATLYTSNTSNWSRNMLQDYSTPISSVIFYTRNILQDWSTPVSTISTTTGQSSNWSRNMLQDYSTPVSTVFFYSRNLLQDFSTPVSSVSTTTGQSSNWSRNMLQDYSTPISSVIFYTRNILQDWSTPVSSVSTAAGATSNWSRGAFQDFSTPVSSLSTYTGTASNWSRGILQDWSTPVNTVMLYTQNTSNWAKGMLVDWSTPLSTATLYTSNTSNFLLPALSNNYSTNLASTVAGLGTANYISASQLYSTVSGVIFNGSTNTLSASRIFTSSLNASYMTSVQGYISSLVVDSLSTLQVNSGMVCAPQIVVSSINGQTLAQLATVPIQSTAIGLGTLGYISTAAFLSSMLGLTSNISSMIDPVELTSSIVGLGTVGFISSIGLTAIMNSTVVGINTYVSSMIDPVELTSTITGLGASGFISTVGLDAKLASTVQGLGSATYISSTSLDARLGSTIQGLGSATYISATQLYSTVTGVIFNGSTNTLSSARIFTSSITASFVTGTQGYISSLVVDSLAIGSNSGFINMGDIITTSHSTLQINTGIFTASGTVCTPQIVVSSINGQTLAQLATVPIQSTVVGLATAGYISSSQLASTQAYLLAVTSTGLSSVALFTSNTSNWSRGLLQDYSTPVSTVFFYSRNLLQDYSTPVSSVSTAAGATSNWSRNLLQDYSTPVSTVFFYSRNLLQDYSTPVSTVFFYSRNLLQDFSTPVSSVSTAAGATSNYARNLLQDYSTPVSTVSTFTGNTSNWSKNLLQDISTPVSSLSTLYGTRLTSLSAAISTLTLQNFTSLQGSVSSLQVNSLLIGTGTGSINLGDTVMTAVSSVSTATNTLYALNTLLGNVSSQTAIQFYGLTGQYNGAVVAEKLVSPGVQELLLYKTSSIQDQIRLQTTGNIVFEAGVASRSWSTSTAAPTPTLYISYLSNVGIGTASPATTLDVAGTGRFQMVSSFALNVSSINGVAPNPFLNGSTLALSTGTVNTSSITTNALQVNSYINAQGGTISNVGTEHFTVSKYTTTFTPLLISGCILWLDAQDPYALSVQPANGTSLTSWKDKSPSGFTFTSAGSAYNTTIMNGLPGISVAVNPFRYNPGSPQNNWQEVFVVAVYSGGGSTFIDTTANRPALITGYSDMTVIIYGGGGESNWQSAGTYSMSNFWQNGVNSTSAFPGILSPSVLRTAYSSPISAVGMNIGTDRNNGGRFNGHVAEVIAYNTALTSNQREQVEGYLAWKWGINSVFPIQYTYYNAPPPPFGTVYLPAGSIGTDTGSNITIRATTQTSINLLGNVQVASTLTVSTVSTFLVNAQTISTPQLIISSINGSTLTQLVGQPLQSTVVGLATTGYVSTSQLVSTQNFLFGTISSGLSSISTYTGTASNWSRNLLQDWSTPVSTISTAAGATSNYARNILQDWSTATQSTVAGLGSAGYISATQLYSTVAGITFSGSTNTLSASRIFTSSLNAAYVTATQGYISSLVVDSLQLGFNNAFFEMGDVIATSLSTLQVNTGILTTSGVICTPQIIVSTINGTAPVNPTNITSTVAGLGTSGYISSFVPVYVSLSTAALFTSNTSNYARNLLQDFSTPTTNTSNFFVPLLANNYSTNLTSTVVGLGTAGYISTATFLSSMLGMTSNISSMIDPVELASSIVGLGTIGFTSSIGLTAILNSTVAGVNTYVSSMIDPVELASSITSLGTQGFISTIGFDAKLASTTAGLGTATYISATQLYSTVAGITFSGSTNTLSSARIFTSSINAAFVTGTQGYISSLVVDSLAIGSNSGFINMGDIITTSHSTLQINTGIFTASGTVCAPQIIVSSINGAVPLVAANITSSIVGLGLAGYLSSVGPLYGVVSSGLSTVATFTSNTSNFFLPALSNNYSTNLQSTFAGLATGGYISSSQLFSTVTALTGSTLSLSAGSVFASSIQTLRLSTAQAAVCTVTFQDQLAGNPMGNVYQYSSILYYNSFVVAGTTAMNIQSFTF